MRLLEILFYSYVGERTWKVENSSKRAWVRKLYQRSDYQTASGRVWGKDNEIRFKGTSSTPSPEISLSPTFFHFKNPRPGRSHCRLDTWGFNFYFTSKLQNWSVFPNVRSVLQRPFYLFSWMRDKPVIWLRGHYNVCSLFERCLFGLSALWLDHVIKWCFLPSIILASRTPRKCTEKRQTCYGSVSYHSVLFQCHCALAQKGTEKASYGNAQLEHMQVTGLQYHCLSWCWSQLEQLRPQTLWFE